MNYSASFGPKPDSPFWQRAEGRLFFGKLDGRGIDAHVGTGPDVARFSPGFNIVETIVVNKRADVLRGRIGKRIHFKKGKDIRGPFEHPL